MVFSLTETVTTEISGDSEEALEEALFAELRRISCSCRIASARTIEVESVNASFGSILRNDDTVVTLRPHRRGRGYVMEARVRYRPSVWFWLFLAGDLLLLEVLVGFLGLVLTLGLYFYNRKLVADALSTALRYAAAAVK
ncbi:MAG: hypothetical protein MR051_05280 [Lentisphaeria bacterium]|nr:hypothetical protein [Lentisphaeria bacterium]